MVNPWIPQRRSASTASVTPPSQLRRTLQVRNNGPSAIGRDGRVLLKFSDFEMVVLAPNCTIDSYVG